jgi:hypothetical protein
MRVGFLEFVKKKKMKVSQPRLEDLLLKNVLEVRFVRRIPVAGKPPTRRMLCTKSYELLNSTNGRIVLNYAPPKRGKQLNEAKENACVVWDILMQNYRIVSAGEVDVLREIPATDEFWDTFNKEIYPMTAEQKIIFMNS